MSYKKAYQDAVGIFEQDTYNYIKAKRKLFDNLSEKEAGELMVSVKDALQGSWRVMSIHWLDYQLELKKRWCKYAYNKESAQFHHRELFYDIAKAHPQEDILNNIVSDTSRAEMYQNEVSSFIALWTLGVTVVVLVITFATFLYTIRPSIKNYITQRSQSVSVVLPKASTHHVSRHPTENNAN